MTPSLPPTFPQHQQVTTRLSASKSAPAMAAIAAPVLGVPDQLGPLLHERRLGCTVCTAAAPSVGYAGLLLALVQQGVLVEQQAHAPCVGTGHATVASLIAAQCAARCQR